MRRNVYLRFNIIWILEQLERLRSENAPRRPMITPSVDSYPI